MLEFAEFHIVKTALTKNRTCQTYRWKQRAKSESLEVLEKIMEENERIVNWDTGETVKSTLDM
jgi:hypothetical protein